MRTCKDLVYPCAMTGATAFFSGIPDISIVIHGSSGCYFYPSTILKREVKTTGVIESDAIFGTYERLEETIHSMKREGHRNIAIITSCVTSVTGEDYSSITDYEGVILVDSPGFLGGPEIGYKKALNATGPVCDNAKVAMNIDGFCKLDPFHRGNLGEARRVFNLAGIPLGSVIAYDTLENIKKPAKYTMNLNPVYESGLGLYCGNFLGLNEIDKFAKKITEIWPYCKTEEIFAEIEKTEERITYACEKYLKRNDPPSIAVFCDKGHFEYIVDNLEKYLDAELICIKTNNNEISDSCSTVNHQSRGASEIIKECKPDLVFGSSFEKAISDKTAFVGVTYPFQDKVSISSRPFVGTEGLLILIEDTLNALRDRSLSHRTP